LLSGETPPSKQRKRYSQLGVQKTIIYRFTNHPKGAVLFLEKLGTSFLMFIDITGSKIHFPSQSFPKMFRVEIFSSQKKKGFVALSGLDVFSLNETKKKHTHEFSFKIL
jgi:hypothetical protein